MSVTDKLPHTLIDEGAWKAEMRKAVESLDEDTRIAVTAGVFRAVLDHAANGGSFRCLIYERLGFSEAAYVPLMLSGGMDVSNEFLMLPRPEHSPAFDALEAAAEAAPMMPHPALTRADGTPIKYPTEERLRLFAAVREFRDLQAAMLAERGIRDKVEAELADALRQVAELQARVMALQGENVAPENIFEKA